MPQPIFHSASPVQRSLLAIAVGSACVHAHAQSTDPLALDPVVVTAQKRPQSLQEVPLSVTVINEEALENARIKTLYDVNQLAPNFEAEKAPGTSVITIRGIGGGGRNIGFDPRVGVYLDGVYMGQAQALGQPLFGIDQVEVLRGPQGYLFGRNSNAGAVNVVTQAPSKTLTGSLRGVVGDHNNYEGYATVSGPLAANVAGQIAVAAESRDGVTTNRFNGEKIDDLERFTTRGQLSFAPSSALKISLYGDYSRTKEKRPLGETVTNIGDRPIPGGPLPAHQVNLNTTPYVNADLSGVNLNVNYALPSGGTITSITAFRHTKQVRQNDTDYSPLDIFKVNYTDVFKQTSQELRYASPLKARLRYVAGLYLLREDAETLRIAMSGADAAAARLPANMTGYNAGTIRTDTAALFGAADFDVTSALTINLGARYTDERKSFFYNLNGAAALGIATVVDFADSRAERRFSPMAGLTYALGNDTHAYAKYSTGFKSGGWNADFVRPSQVADGLGFDTETVKSYELGLKGKALGGRVQYALAGFTSRFDNFQTFAFIPLPNGTAVLQLKNAAKVNSDGAELSVTARITSSLRASVNVGYVDARYASFPNGGGVGVDLSGTPVPNVARMTSSLALNYTVAVPALGGQFDAYADYSHRDRPVQDAGLPQLSARDLINLHATFTPDRAKWALSLWSRNVTNQSYLIASGRDFFSNQFVTRGEARSFGADFRYMF